VENALSLIRIVPMRKRTFVLKSRFWRSRFSIFGARLKAR
jgi:hypothetical protein